MSDPRSEPSQPQAAAPQTTAPMVAAPKESPPNGLPDVEWLVLFYLAGDLDSPRSMSIREDLCEILSAGKDTNGKMHVVVQFDSLANCFRYVLESDACELKTVQDTMAWPQVRDRDSVKVDPNRPVPGSYATEISADDSKRQRPEEVLGRINSGSADELEHFIVWGLSQAKAKKVALVVAGKDRLDPVLRGGQGRRLPQVFTLCRDDSTRDHLSFVEFSRAIENALRKSKLDKGKLDILAIDSAQSQFLELAHELEKSVEVLIGAQTPIPMKGWDYQKVITAWRKVLAGNDITPCSSHQDGQSGPEDPPKEGQSGPAHPHTVKIAECLIEAIRDSYGPGEVKTESATPEAYAVSAIDLTQLPAMTANFDSACMTFMQSLGEGVVWEGRQVLRKFLDLHIKNNQYDCGIFFRGLSLTMGIKCLCPVYDWLIWDLEQHGIGEHNGRFWNHVLDSIRTPKEPIPQPNPVTVDGKEFVPVIEINRKVFLPIQQLGEAIGQRWKLDIYSDRDPHPKHSKTDGKKEKTGEGDLGLNKINQLVDHFRTVMTQLLDACVADPSEHIEKQLKFLQAQDLWLERMVLAGAGFPSEERRKSFEHMKINQETTKRIAKQAWGLVRFFPPRESVRAGKGPTEEQLQGESYSPLVLAAACTDPKKEIWWTGLSLYRPGDLDMLMNQEYRDFSFHRKVHWTALLGAIYLIEAEPPLAMWRLISSLITRGSGSTRRDLLDHLSGEKSVIWGMENQFRILAPAPVITLTLEHRETIQNRSRLLQPPGKGNGAFSSSAVSGLTGGDNSDDHVYLVRLESHRQGAIIFEHSSRVRAVTLKRVLTNLGDVLQGSTKEERSFSRLTSLGSILGDEVLQELGRALESEQRSIRREVLRRNGIRRCDQRRRRDDGGGEVDVMSIPEDEKQNVDVHLQLHIPRELMHHPWELMSIHDRMLGYRFAIGRRVFMDTASFRGDREREQGTIRPLLVVPSYEGVNELRETKREKEDIRACFIKLKESRGQVVMFDPENDILEGEQATWLNFLLKLHEGRYDIIHFAGHGSFVENDPEASAWVFADGNITAREIRNALRNHPAPPWLVYANACKAGRSSRSHTSPYIGEVHGLATAFICNGVAAYVGPLWDLGDSVARRIAVDFYKELLLQGATLGEALLRAKRRVKMQFDEEKRRNDEKARDRSLPCGTTGSGTAGETAVGNKAASGDTPADATSPPQVGNIPTGTDAVSADTAASPSGTASGSTTVEPEKKEGTRGRKELPPCDDISGAGIVLFGDTSGELIQALAGIEKVSRSESGEFYISNTENLQRGHNP